MATIKFILRGGTSETSSIYFRYRPSRSADLLLATPFKINPNDWDEVGECRNVSHKIKSAKTAETKILNAKIDDFNTKLSLFRRNVTQVIDDNVNLEFTDLKELVKDYVLKNYFANRINNKPKKKGKPEKMSDLIDFYIDFRSVEDRTKGTKPLAANTIKKYHTLQKVLNSYRKDLAVTEINDLFRNDFIKYMNGIFYSENTQVKYLKDIKMLCKFANTDHAVSKDVMNWEIQSQPENVAEYVSLTFGDLNALHKAVMPTESLDNVRDWLLISCYTSLRISELLNMKRENITIQNERYYIKVIEKKNINHKGGGLKYIYLMPEVVEILEKRKGDFPKKISDQRYNIYIKQVCRIAGLTHKVTGGTHQVKNGQRRKIKATGELCDMITSHSGRATYVTLFSQIFSTDIIQMQTNHSSREMVERYNKTDKEELALRKAQTVAQAHEAAKEKYSHLKIV